MQIMMYYQKVVICPQMLQATRGDDTGGRAARRVEEVVATRGDGGVETTAGRGEVGQQGGLRKDVHRGGGHRGHQGLRRRRDGDGARRGRAARRVEDVRQVEDVADTNVDHGGSWRGGGVDRGGV
uniref:Uncharacterized protein n=1 Tax=Triticum urartu TaxID=4572 RepID=A0A8R7U4X4_TRIUA